MRDTNATWYSAVPTIHNLLLSRAGKERPAGREGLRFIRSCSASLPPEMMEKMEERVRRPGARSLWHDGGLAPDVAPIRKPPHARKPGSVGPGTGVKIGIMDDAGNLLPAGGARRSGHSRAPTWSPATRTIPRPTAKSFTNGWFRTGDQGFLDAEGYLDLTGRIKELINRGGEKIGPREIDEVLLSHPAVAEALCFGVPHPSWGEEVERRRGAQGRGDRHEAAILAFCKERLADFKTPQEDLYRRASPSRARPPAKSSAARSAKAFAGG